MKKIVLIFFILFVNLIFAQTIRLSDSTILAPLPFYRNIDSLIIERCDFNNFNGEAIRFENVNVVYIKECSFSNIQNLISTRGVICGKKSKDILLQKLIFKNIGGTAIRFPTDGESSYLNRLINVTIDSVTINKTYDPSSLESNGIRVFHTDSLYIKNCFLKNINDNAINLGRNSSGQTQIDQRISYTEITNNIIDSVLGNGILANENVLNATILNNVITNIATDGIGMLASEGDHGIYWQGVGAIIRENKIKNVRDGILSGNTGNGISIRTNARVLMNEVSGCTRNGIAYWNDHPSYGTLEISNNLIYDNIDNGIYINGSGPNLNKPDSVLVFHNTVHNTYNSGLIHKSSPIALNTLPGFNIIVGNLLLFDNIFDTTKFISFLGNIPSKISKQNYYANMSSGFEDLINYNYHLTYPNPAINSVDPTITGVLIDKDRNIRSALSDAGCFEYISPNYNLSPSSTNTLSVFPNPVSTTLFINQLQNIQSLNMEVIDVIKNISVLKLNSCEKFNTIDFSSFASGIYFICINHDKKSTIIKLVKE